MPAFGLQNLADGLANGRFTETGKPLPHLRHALSMLYIGFTGGLAGFEDTMAAAGRTSATLSTITCVKD